MSRPSFFGIGVWQPKREVNVGSLYRSAASFGSAMTFQVGGRFERQCSDTTNTSKLIPHFVYESPDSFWRCRPHACELVAVELDEAATPLATFRHPRHAVYLLGAEDGGIPKGVLAKAQHVVQIPGRYCLNVAVAGSIVMYDRLAKAGA